MELDFSNWAALVTAIIGIAVGTEQFVQTAKQYILRPLRDRFYPTRQQVYYFTIHVTAFGIAFGSAWLVDVDFFAMLGWAVVEPVGHVATALIAFSGAQRANIILEAIDQFYNANAQQSKARAENADGAVG